VATPPIARRFAIALGSLAALSTVGLYACTQPAGNAGASLVYDEKDPQEVRLRERGLALRSAIDAFYRERAGNASSNASSAALSDLVERYVPWGSPMSDARRILAFAGLTVSSSQTDHYPRVYASIPQYVWSIPNTKLGITLYPTGRFDYVADPGSVDWSSVRKVTASFFVVWS
jgi:hypothetical protein